MTSREPKVSLGLPVYNGERYLAEAIDSILNQTYEEFELIISDNASIDGTGEICQDYLSDHRVRYYRNERNLGAGPNFNRTFDLARGMYFKWVAHDDLLEPTYLERCVAVLDANPSAVLCQTGIRQIDENGRTVEPVHVPLVGGDDPSPSRRFARNVLSTHSCRDIFGLIRREALRGMPLHEGCLDTDRMILAELSLRGRFLHAPEPLFIHRDHPQRFIHTAYDDRNARITWYDPSRTGDRSWHYAALYRGYFAAVRRSALAWRTKLACYGYLFCCPAAQGRKFAVRLYQNTMSLIPSYAPSSGG